MPQNLARPPLDKWAINDPGLLTAGEETFSRDKVVLGQSILTTSSGRLLSGVFTARKTETCTGVRVWTGGTAAAATPTLCQLAVFELLDTGAWSQVAITANNTAWFATLGTSYDETLSSFTKQAGSTYAAALLVISAQTMPNFVGQPSWGETNTAPPVGIRVDGLSSMPATIYPNSGAGSPFVSVSATGTLYAVVHP